MRNLLTPYQKYVGTKPVTLKLALGSVDVYRGNVIKDGDITVYVLKGMSYFHTLTNVDAVTASLPRDARNALHALIAETVGNVTQSEHAEAHVESGAKYAFHVSASNSKSWWNGNLTELHIAIGFMSGCTIVKDTVATPDVSNLKTDPSFIIGATT